jgi:hypothetical protein
MDWHLGCTVEQELNEAIGWYMDWLRRQDIANGVPQ